MEGEVVAPGGHEVQIVVLGRGIGESVLVHLPGGRWFVVDSFRGSMAGTTDRDPAPLAYLAAIGVTDLASVEGVYLTHLHADHSDGIDKIVKKCANAKFWLPLALPEDHIEQLLIDVEAEENTKFQKKSLKGVSNALRLAKAESRFGSCAAVNPTTSTLGELVAIGPSEAAKNAAAGFTHAAASLGASNLSSIVLRVESGEARALLTGDMVDDAPYGWPTIVSERATDPWAGGARLIKVPHHGSSGAQHDGMYAAFTVEPKAIVVPNTGSNLPNETGTSLIEPRVAELWLAGLPDLPAMTGNQSIYWVTATADPDDGDWQLRARDEDEQKIYSA